MARKSLIVQAGHFTVPVGRRTHIMGIMNLTPDSFSGDGRLGFRRHPSAHVRFALGLVKAGADFIDIGAESSRPGAGQVKAAVEIQRLSAVLKTLVPRCPVPISVDTYKPDVAKAALDLGVVVINTIMGNKPDKKLLTMVRDYGAAIVLMHNRGTFKTMHRRYTYRNLLREVSAELRNSIEFCLETGIKKDRIIVDPGIGFAKTAEQNLTLLKNLRQIHVLGFPVLVGTSRKSFIGKVLGAEVQDRILGTAATAAITIAHGAHILRVHDVAAIKQAARMTDAIFAE